MAIVIDGVNFSVFNTKYDHERLKFANIITGSLGDPIRIEGGAFRNTYPLTLLVTRQQFQALDSIFGNTTTSGTPPANLHTLTDEEGVTYYPNTGTDTSTKKYSTGVYVDAPGNKLVPKPITPKGWTDSNRFLVDVLITINSKVNT